jgi:hypothetical protein
MSRRGGDAIATPKRQDELRPPITLTCTGCTGTTKIHGDVPLATDFAYLCRQCSDGKKRKGAKILRRWIDTPLHQRAEGFVNLPLEGNEVAWFEFAKDLKIDEVQIQDLAEVLRQGRWRESRKLAAANGLLPVDPFKENGYEYDRCGRKFPRYKRSPLSGRDGNGNVMRCGGIETPYAEVIDPGPSEDCIVWTGEGFEAAHGDHSEDRLYAERPQHVTDPRLQAISRSERAAGKWRAKCQAREAAVLTRADVEALKGSRALAEWDDGEKQVMMVRGLGIPRDEYAKGLRNEQSRKKFLAAWRRVDRKRPALRDSLKATAATQDRKREEHYYFGDDGEDSHPPSYQPPARKVVLKRAWRVHFAPGQFGVQWKIVESKEPPQRDWRKGIIGVFPVSWYEFVDETERDEATVGKMALASD